MLPQARSAAFSVSQSEAVKLAVGANPRKGRRQRTDVA
jgi:hypothetical protein